MNTANYLELRPASVAGAGHADPGFRGSNVRETESQTGGFSHMLDAQSGGTKQKDQSMEGGFKDENADGATRDIPGNGLKVPEREDAGTQVSEGETSPVGSVQSDSGLEMKSPDRKAATDTRELQSPLVSDAAMKRLASTQVSQQQSTLASSSSLHRVAMVSGESKHSEGGPKVGIAVSSVALNGKSALLGAAPAGAKETTADSMPGLKSRFAETSIAGGSPIAPVAGNRLSVSSEGGGLEKRSYEPGAGKVPVAEKASPSALVGNTIKTGGSANEGFVKARSVSGKTEALKPAVNSGVGASVASELREKSTLLKGAEGLELSEKHPLLKNLKASMKGDLSDSGAEKVSSSKSRVEGAPAQGLTQQALSARNENGKTVEAAGDEQQASRLPQSAKSSRVGERNANGSPLIQEFERKSELRTFDAWTENRLGDGKSGIGIARAMLGGESDPLSRVAMIKAVQKSDTKPTSQGLSDTAAVQESKGLQAVARTEIAQSASSQGSGMGEQQGRGGSSETYRHYAQEIAEGRSNAQAATQSQFMDRSVASQLSTAVVNQILNHLEKLRESDRGKVRLQLGSEDSGSLAVQISIAGGVVRTVFEGDESVLRQIQSDWQWIQSRASQRGVDLEQPQYLSNSLVSGGASLFPDDAMLTGNQIQSVIQQSENQPVRPEFQTAVSGTSGPVHLYA